MRKTTRAIAILAVTTFAMSSVMKCPGANADTTPTTPTISTNAR